MLDTADTVTTVLISSALMTVMDPPHAISPSQVSGLSSAHCEIIMSTWGVVFQTIQNVKKHTSLYIKYFGGFEILYQC